MTQFSLCPSQSLGAGNAIDGNRVSGGPEGNLLLGRPVRDLTISPQQNFLHLRVDAVLVPENLLEVLGPFEIRHRDAAGVGQDVRQNVDAAGCKGLVRFGRGGEVRTFGDDPGSNPVCVLLVDDALESGGDQEVADETPEAVVLDFLAAPGTLDGAGFTRVLKKGLHVKPPPPEDP